MSRFNGILQILTLRCEAAAALASRELDEPLSRLERTALMCHLLACRSCRRFRRQARLIHRAFRRREGLGCPAPVDAGEGLSAEARARMTRALREAIADQAEPEGPHDEAVP